ncbi:MAG TPA: hypothetical protein VHE36_05755 [Sphingomicrobium sp.]|jgi:hypothetical protein|nr:hypothetical protein [Sphingomicrobium sp.]
MNSVLITIAATLSVVLIHFSIVDFRFRYRDGLLWFWLVKPASAMMWIARGSLLAALVAALSGLIVGTTITYVVVVGAVLLLHVASLVLFELLESR